MGTTNPRPRGDNSLRGQLRADRKDREQIRRLASRPQKSTPVAAPAVAGSVSGVRWRAWGMTGTAGTIATTSATMNFDPAHVGIQPKQLGPNAAPSFTFDVSTGSFVAAVAGYYDFAITAKLVFAADPGLVYLSWDGPDDAGLYVVETWGPVGFTGPGVPGQLQARETYRTYLPAGGSLFVGWAWDKPTTCQVPDGNMDIWGRVG